jgi:hypothetical protein
MFIHGIGFPELVVMLVFAVILFDMNKFRDKIGPAIRDLLRGGPRPPSHPIPADDSRIINRPRRPFQDI